MRRQLRRQLIQTAGTSIVTGESHVIGNELLTGCNERDRVEKRVECLKGPITVRPISLHQDERILGLLFAHMMALLAFGITEMRVPS